MDFRETYGDDIVFSGDKINALPNKFCNGIYLFVAIWFGRKKFSHPKKGFLR